MHVRKEAVRDAGDWEGWLEFFLKGVIDVSRQAAETARRILVLREEHRDLIARRLGRAAGNGHRVLQRLYDRPIVSAKHVKELLGTGQARHRRYSYRPCIALFDDERGW